MLFKLFQFPLDFFQFVVSDYHIPNNAVATRLTDDDFVILLTHSTVNDAIGLTEEIRKDSHVLRYLRGDKSLQVTVSAGIAELNRKSSAGDSLTASRIACVYLSVVRDGVSVSTRT